MTKPAILLYVGLSLLPQAEEWERSWVNALGVAASGIDGILLALPSWQEAPDALQHELVKDALEQCRRHELDVYLGRDLWIRWKGHSPYQQQRDDAVSAAYYASYLSRLDGEARAIGAKGTFAECEPYGDTIFKPWFKQDGFSAAEFNRVLTAIGKARSVAPAATMAYPAGGQHSNHYSWALRYLGKESLHSKTYQVRAPYAVNAAPPMFYPLQLNWWGSWLKAAGPAGSGPLTVAEFRLMDWDAVRAQHPEFKGVWIYMSDKDRKQVMEQLGSGG